MQPTTLGPNLTGAALAPESVQAMTEAADALTPQTQVDTSALQACRLACASEADAVGSVPPPVSLTGIARAGLTKLKGGQPTIFLDKLGERLAYERSGTRLYETLLVKLHAAQEIDADALAADELTHGESPAQTLDRIRREELAHFVMLTEAIAQLGGDPTAQTPCADIGAVAASGFVQVLNDPRTTLAQCLNAMLAVELADNAGWELLIALAAEAGEDELAARFRSALDEEEQHLVVIKRWLVSLLATAPQPELV